MKKYITYFIFTLFLTLLCLLPNSVLAAWVPIQGDIQYVDGNGDPYSGAVLKAYKSGTTTNISLATDRDWETNTIELKIM